MRGSVGLRKNDSIWALLGIARKYRAEVVSDDGWFAIRWSQKFANLSNHYELWGGDGILQRCALLFDGSMYRMDLSLQGDRLLEYQVDTSGNALFRTPDVEISTAIKVSGNKRSYSIDEMRFDHADYQSCMRFECKQERLHQAVLVANLLFNPPQLNQDD
ncbi:MAG: hypothetical protein ACSHYB_13850 [Roseibacillus sp.]